jgi:hypothetical protein
MAVMPPAYRTMPKRGTRFSRKIMRRLALPSAAQHFPAPKQCKSHWESFPCPTEIVMFLPPRPENDEIYPLKWRVSHALKHVIFAINP